MTGTAERKVGRPKGRTSDRNDVSVKIDKAIAEMAKSIAKSKGLTLAEVLSEAARVNISRGYAQMLRNLETTE